MCKRSGETIDHLLLHYGVARELWVLIFCLLVVEWDQWVMSRRVIDLLVSWRDQLGSFNILESWRMTPLCLRWCIWREWNTRRFEDYKISVVELKTVVFKAKCLDDGVQYSSLF